MAKWARLEEKMKVHAAQTRLRSGPKQVSTLLGHLTQLGQGSERNLGTTAHVATKLFKKQEINVYCIESVCMGVFLLPEPSLHRPILKLTVMQGRIK